MGRSLPNGEEITQKSMRFFSILRLLGWLSFLAWRLAMADEDTNHAAFDRSLACTPAQEKADYYQSVKSSLLEGEVRKSARHTNTRSAE